jgi:hypothetical protein
MLLILLMPSFLVDAQDTRRTSRAEVHFVSDASLERIEASCTEGMGIISFTTGEFVFRIPIRSFKGFNSPLQQEHFYENYLETESYPYATFSGRVLDEVDWSVDQSLTIKVKGTLDIHGVADERILEVDVKIEKGKISFSASFDVELVAHDIRIPKVVHYKIAEIIHVDINGILE